MFFLLSSKNVGVATYFLRNLFALVGLRSSCSEYGEVPSSHPMSWALKLHAHLCSPSNAQVCLVEDSGGVEVSCCGDGFKQAVKLSRLSIEYTATLAKESSNAPSSELRVLRATNNFCTTIRPGWLGGWRSAWTERTKEWECAERNALRENSEAPRKEEEKLRIQEEEKERHVALLWYVFLGQDWHRWLVDRKSPLKRQEMLDAWCDADILLELFARSTLDHLL